MEGNMQSPIAGLMGLAGGAIGLIQKALAPAGGKSGFDEQLNTALAGGTKTGKLNLKKLISADGSIDNDALKELMASPQAVQLLQYMNALKSLGVNSQDAQALLLGKGGNVSDDAIKAILASCGIKDGDISQIMTDPKLLADMKAKLAETVSSHVSSNTQDMNLLIQQATADQPTYDTVIAGFVAAKGFHNGLEGAQNNTSTAKASEISEKAPEIQAKTAAVPEGAVEIKKTIMACLKGIDGSITNTVQTASDNQPAVAQAVSTLEQTFGIPKNVQKDLFFSKDPLTRQTALDQATAKINSSLAANADKPLSNESTDALAFLKGALSKEEFAPIEKAVNLASPDTMLAGTTIPINKNGFEALAHALGQKSDASLNQLTQQVMDQIKQAMPQQVKNGEGSISMELHPPMLGRIDVDIQMTNGQIQAAFKADQPITRDILQQNMHILKDALAEQGVQVAQVSVSTDVNSRNSQQNTFAWAGFQNGNHGSSQNNGEQDASGTQKGHEDYSYVPAAANGYTESGGLDIFA
jgi:flagellar hook-length control protein FliK